MQKRRQDLFDLIDNANSADPVLEDCAGKTLPRALLYGQRMSECLRRLYPHASLELCIAARAQHICRWQIPRSHYPQGRSGYLTWRRDLAGHHARLATELMKQLDMDTVGIERVQTLLQKKNLKSDADTQALEDVACLVFLKHYLTALCEQQSDEKIVAILGKTWRKMSTNGQQAALKMKLSISQQQLLHKALEPK